MFDFTVIIPCLNEAETVGKCVRKAIRKFSEMGINGEVVVADNGSTDSSQEIAIKEGARVVNVPFKGYGNALYHGIMSAKSKFVLMGDGDDSYDFSEIDKFYNKLKEGYEYVMGCRLPWGGGTVKSGAMPFHHLYFGNPGLTLLSKLLFRSKVNDLNCGMRAFTIEAFKKMNMTTAAMEFASEMVIKASLWKLKTAQVPITLHKDGRSRPPHLKSWSDGWKILRFMLLMSPRWTFKIPGFILFILGLLLINQVIFQPFQFKKIELDVVYNGIVKDPWGNTKAGFKITGKIMRFDYGLKWNNVMESGSMVVSDEVMIMANIELAKGK